jgi:ElaB/YqjD/DUF883 family membrane-anchored ribosome-binding protein
MPNDSTSSSFPSTRQDISNLKQTATDAVNDLGSTAAVHVSKAKGQLKELAGHAQEEGSDQLDQVKGRFTDVLESAKAYASEKPLACIGIALGVGFLLGLSRRSSKY